MRAQRFIQIALLLVIVFVVQANPSWAQTEEEPVASPEPNNPNTIDLVVGETQTISAVGVDKYSEGREGVAEVRSTRGEFVIVGVNPGSTSLLLIYRDGHQVNWTINVFARALSEVEREVEELLGGAPGVRLRRVGTRFFIEGGVGTEAEVERMERIASLYPGQVESLVVAGSGVADQKVNIRIDFFFVQYDKRSGYGVGVDMPTRFGGEAIQSEFTYDFLAGTTTSATASVVNQPLPALDIASNYGWAKILKQSTVITVNGTEALFSSGGEQNYRIAAGMVADIRPIEFGTTVKVLPRLDPETGDLEVEVEADVSDLVPAAQGGDLPGRSISHLNTLVRLKLGQSLVLSGIRTRTQRSSVRGLPLLSEIPVLGLMFGTHSGSSEDLEGAVFIIPSAVESAPQSALEMVQQALDDYESYHGNLRDVDPYPTEQEAWSETP